MIRSVLFTLLFSLFFFGLQQWTYAAEETTEDKKPVDVTYHTSGSNLNIDEYGDFTPVENVGALAQKTLVFLMSILGGVALLGIVYGGVLIMTGGAHENNIERGKDILFYSLIGVGVALMAIVITTLAQSFFYSFGE